ncbi:hypothetical protein [Dyella caseinilytica]|uniref:Uncharacterized protein n=1 Tax=Dyella caseinilytica TaxID=1849581 RepID=A0ABX7GQF7_9GAMM|nr:hypothetical protein [Dyella caseinilytica]QRN52303.1 hypothetical protein ISN74_12490 [Dyella caseinilytica]GGA14698.1 hypothetical protein GCM10011408_40710 [Dyella caseinilytica]
MKLVATSIVSVIFAFASVETVAANNPLQGILSTLQSSVPPEQYQLFDVAIKSSPTLTAQLNELASSGQLTAFKVGERSTLPPTRGPFGGYVSGTTWAFTPTFVQQQAKTRYYDVVMPDDVLGNNMVFALGELAYRTKAAPDVEAAEQVLKAQFAQNVAAARQASQPINADNFMRESIALQIRNTASGFIQGWNDMLEAAVQDNGGKVLTIRQLVSLTMNFRYRAVFMRAMRLPDHKLNFANDGRIEPNDANRDAIANALKTMSVYDLQ